MKLTSYSNYCLRVLMVAAARSPDLTTIQDVAIGFGVSKAHLVKCAHQLGTWGYLETVRGNKGGFRLARPANAIRLGEVIRRTEEGFELVECFDADTNTCPLIEKCKLSMALRRALEAFLAILDDITLADITTNGNDLLTVLDLQLPPASGRVPGVVGPTARPTPAQPR
ncbi:HTH-type transcriptional regulator NsrR [Methylocella tundrae]|uniref:HTH-type transcriptional regulator NsrR n=1 Tax=Methylocella tundrae TaxID=227605 RepID=A0A8B6MCN0_METTU|nr:Rrf2 family transcriptional regulator [Methylocella tundrae]VTZ21100.1 HTH-type transcriptional regulator NsrR [Methylocella tundrae]VTZ51918.1 HTH-type transcriptional regulator NsrR [Methylocella tundrae]